MTLPPIPTTKPRSDSASSRNDLFNTSWAPELRPPKPLPPPPPAPRVISTSTPGSGQSTSTIPRLRKDSGDAVSEFGSITTAASQVESGPAPASTSRTSSFFDKPTELPLPLSRSSILPRPPSPLNLNLSRKSSLSTSTSTNTTTRTRPPAPLYLISSDSNRIQDKSSPGPSSTLFRPRAVRTQTPPVGDTEPLSPLHQSPSLPPIGDWTPPRPPVSDDIALRLKPRSMYLLGEGRYATVFLGSYKKEGRREKERRKDNPVLKYGASVPIPVRLIRDRDRERESAGGSTSTREAEDEMEVNEAGNGYTNGSWRLCAAKRMAPDRQSQTMGLREAFFLNRLSSTAALPTARPSRLDPGLPGAGLSRTRAVSPLRDGFPRRSGTSSQTSTKPQPNGSVYVIKLIAVKEDIPPRTTTSSSGQGQGHSRSISDAIQDGSRSLARQRSSTMMNRTRDEKLDDSPINQLNSFPSLPSLAQAAKVGSETAPALSRLVLVLEHAPLGTMDRLLRTSPDLVGKKLWQRWAVQTTDALHWVHGKGIVHADIKAGNLLLTANLDVRLSDFGSSLLIHPSHPPTDGVGLGTLPFSPPELVDPESTFSFPVDIFSLGATLYQCITGREPYRGCRTIEMMHHVRKGGLWPWEERERMSRIGQAWPQDESGGSPYPSAWRGDDYAYSVGLGGVRRAGSLRVPTGSNANSNVNTRRGDRPKLGRMGSTESLRASEDTGHTDSPAAVKSWGKWISTFTRSSSSSNPTDPISLLLSESDLPITSPTSASSSVPRHASTLRVGTPSYTSPMEFDSASSPDTGIPSSADSLFGREPSGPAYSDGSPAMFFLDGGDRVDEEIWTTLRAMLLPKKESRPSAEQLKDKWEELGLVLSDDEGDV